MKKLMLMTFATFSLAIVAKANLSWNNIVNITVGYGRTYNLNNPSQVIRPYKGNLFRLSIPQTCGTTLVNAVMIWGRTLQGQRVSMPAYLTGQFAQNGMNSWVYSINNNNPATIREIGLDIQTTAINGCALSFEQANEFGNPNPNPNPNPQACDLNYACPQYADNTRYCQALPFTSGGSFVEYAMQGDNSCTITQKLKAKICQQGMLPTQFNIQCQ